LPQPAAKIDHGMIGSALRRALQSGRSAWESARERFDCGPSPLAADGVPLPSAYLRRLVAGTEDEGWFLAAGRAAVGDLAPLVAGREPATVLDFGCGCGRVARAWNGRGQVGVAGVDTHPLAIRWCRRNLSGGRFFVAELGTELPFADREFDLVYALSVLTHLNVPLQEQVLAEIARTLKPDGRFAVSLHGVANAAALVPELRKEFDAGRIVVAAYGPQGSNFVNAFHPHAAAVELFSRWFELESFRPSGASGNPPQDLYILRRRVKAA
jgi:SAM-dependent methyltransferase